VGTSLPGVRIIVVDDKDQPLGPNQEGEILIAGPNVMTGYYKLDDQTSQAFVDLPDPDAAPDEQGVQPTRRFFRTGDIGKQDEDGFLYITGRKKEMLIIGGENVFPREIEAALEEHADVVQAAVIGVPDEHRGEAPIAFVIRREGATVDGPTLRTHAKGRLAGFKVPREVHVRDELPLSPTGKILKRKLHELLDERDG
jgi:acyl-CoA synthetase (AMP-forming)/AMP-acid ligase II